MPLTVFPRDGLPVMGSVNDSMACSVPSETSKLIVLEDLGFVFSPFWNETHSSIDQLLMEPGHILLEQCQVGSTSGAVHRSSHTPVSSDKHQFREDAPLQVEADISRLGMCHRTLLEGKQSSSQHGRDPSCDWLLTDTSSEILVWSTWESQFVDPFSACPENP